jgi:MFS family permease
MCPQCALELESKMTVRNSDIDVRRLTASSPVELTNARRWLPWPKRFDVALMSFLAQLIAYCDRVNLSVAAPMIAAEYGWSPAQMGWVFSGFFGGYMLLMIPIGYLVDRVGPKRTLASGMAWWSLMTLLTPMCQTVTSMTAARVLIGIGESGTIPSINSMLVRWFPRTEYSRVAGFAWAGGFAGAIFAFPLASAAAALWGWRAIFALFAALGFLWLPFWILGASDRPTPAGQHGVDPTGRSRSNIGALLRNRSVWALFCLHFSSNWYVYVLASWLPTYLLSHRGFSLSQMAFGSSMPFLAAFIGTNLAGNLIDRFTTAQNRARVRKAFLIPSFLGTATLLIVPAVETQFDIVTVLCLSMLLHAAGTPVQASNAMDLAPGNTGTLVGFQNCFANIAGVTAPVITGHMVMTTGWTSVFWLSTAVGAAGITGFLLFGRSEQISNEPLSLRRTAS